MSSWLDAYTLAARRANSLPDDWFGYEFTKCSGRGLLVKGLVCRERISRGPSKGQPRYRTGDKSTECTVFVGFEETEAVARELGVSA